MLHKKVHTPRDVDYHFAHEIGFNPAEGYRPSKYGTPNLQAAAYNAGDRPSGIPANHNRLTIAMDVGFWGDYLNLYHLVMTARLKTDNYQGAGDARCGAAAVGSWGAQHGFPAVTRGAAIEEPEINNQYLNQFHYPMSHCVTENKRYRLILDSILYNDQMAHEIRLKDHTTGLIVYSSSGTAFSSFTNHYNTQSDLIVICTIAPETPINGGGSYSNLVSYWTLANEWVPDP
ncbi:hypothetical protein [Allofranklinella schreckenbergeri]|uniref:hypothetical protein n=1 Tax=Allofranklinella schreckenbergeri TaxID=1076744 RepID=UPI0011C43143|nr:hypothetical protein [Allofranklinella schreckenbergeri]